MKTTLAAAAGAVWAAAGDHTIEVDQAGWHISERLIVPPNLTIVPPPAKCPELHPVQNVWQFIRGNWLSNRVFASYTDATSSATETEAFSRSSSAAAFRAMPTLPIKPRPSRKPVKGKMQR